MDKAKEYLRGLQSRYPTMSDMADWDQVIKYRQKQISATDQEISSYLDKVKELTKTELFENTMRKFLLDPFLEILPNEVYVVLSNIHVGLLPTFLMNATALRTPDGEQLIVVHSHLFTALSQFNEAQLLVGKLMHVKDGRIVGEGVGLMEEIYKEIVNCFRLPNYALRMNKLPAVLPEDLYLFSLSKTFLQELFIILHEYAHIYLGHLDEVKEMSLNKSSIETPDISVYVRKQHMELEADLQAFRWLQIACKNPKMEGVLGGLTVMPVLALETLLIMHMFEVNTDSFYQDIQYSSETIVGRKLNRRYFDTIRVVKALSLKDDIAQIRQHPLALTRCMHVFTHIKDELSNSDRDFVQQMLYKMCAYETFKLTDLN